MLLQVNVFQRVRHTPSKPKAIGHVWSALTDEQCDVICIPEAHDMFVFLDECASGLLLDCLDEGIDALEVLE